MYQGRYIVDLVVHRECFLLPANRWARSERGRLFCPNCLIVRQELYPQPVDMYLHQLPNGTSYGSVFGACVGVIHRALYEELTPHLSHLARGRCFWENGSPLDDYYSVYHADRICIRGDSTGIPYVCKVCRSILDACTDDPYVLRSELPDYEVFQDRICSLYVSEDLAERVDWTRFPDIELVRIEVRDELQPDDPRPAVEEAIQQLMEAFEGDWDAAFAAVDQEARSIRMPEGPQRMCITVRGVNLILRGFVTLGVMRYHTFRAP
jgi:hypothetical protein